MCRYNVRGRFRQSPIFATLSILPSRSKFITETYIMTVHIHIHLYQHNSNSLYVTRIHLHDKFPTRTRNDNTILVLKGGNKLISRFWWHINARIKICDVRPSLPSSVLDGGYLFLGRLFRGSLAPIMGLWWIGTTPPNCVMTLIGGSCVQRGDAGLFLDELAPTSNHFSLLLLLSNLQRSRHRVQ